jgi:hypothetical protein
MIHHLGGKVISRASFDRIWQNKLRFERVRLKLLYKEIQINAKVSIGIFFDNLLYFVTSPSFFSRLKSIPKDFFSHHFNYIRSYLK